MLSNHLILCFPLLLLRSVFPSIRVMWPDAMILVFWMLSFKPAFSLSSYTVIKNIFSSSSLSAIRVVSSAYLRLLVFLLAILIPACESSSQAFCMMHISFAFSYKLNKQGDNISPVILLFQFWNSQFCRFLTCIQISQETGKVVWYSYLFKNFPQFVVFDRDKGFS